MVDVRAYLDEHSWLVVRVGGEDLLLLGGDGGVSLDEGGHDTTSSLQTQGQWGHIQKQQVLHLLVCLSAQNGSLHAAFILSVLRWQSLLVGLKTFGAAGAAKNDEGRPTNAKAQKD